MPTTVRLDAETERRLARLAARTGRSKAALLREIVSRGIEDSEDYWLAAAVCLRDRQGLEKTYTAAEVRKELGLST